MNDDLSSETEAVWRLHCPMNAAKARRFKRLRRPITQLCTGRDAAASDDLKRRLLEAARKNPTSGAEFTCRFTAYWSKRTLDPARARV
ncbi:hypothetical protein [Bosea beijingensis]|uniref:hypothetical protein n=1 Tax=Bosea beijingensis TaxID=3068632 RepID=UPI0027407B9D|nr:hypothetical protein [Bosea sp. REN20]